MTLERIAEILLRPATSARDLARAADDFYECLSRPVMERLEKGSLPPTSLPHGVALSPSAAAACLKDPVRTAVFLRGVDAALAGALQRFPGETIEVVYAGTGPLAPLAFPFLVRAANARVRFTFVDLHPESIAATRVLAGRFGVTGAIEFVVGDAASYEHPHGRRLHGLVTETMQAALLREPQVAITRQIAPQIVPGGFLVPASVRVDLLLGDAGAWGRENRDEREVEDLVFVQTLFELCAGVEGVPIDDAGRLSGVRVRLPSDPPLSKQVALYGTTIVTYGEHVIRPGRSGLTLPVAAEELMPLEPGRNFDVRYQLGTTPRFVVQRV